MIVTLKQRLLDLEENSMQIKYQRNQYHSRDILRHQLGDCGPNTDPAKYLSRLKQRFIKTYCSKTDQHTLWPKVSGHLTMKQICAFRRSYFRFCPPLLL